MTDSLVQWAFYLANGDFYLLAKQVTGNNRQGESASANIKSNMSQSKVSTAAFISLATLVVLASATALAYSWPYAQGAARGESSRLVGDAARAKPTEALADYQLAVWLDPASIKAKLGLAAAQIKASQAEAALVTLEGAGQGSEAADLRLRANIELGRTDPGSGLAALIGRQDSPEAVQALDRAEAGQLPLAVELYAAGLPESSSAILLKLPTSFERNLLLARINYDRHTLNSLVVATDNLSVAVALNPSDISAHRLYATVLAERGLNAESSHQTDLIRRLTFKRP